MNAAEQVVAEGARLAAAAGYWWVAIIVVLLGAVLIVFLPKLKLPDLKIEPAPPEKPPGEGWWKDSEGNWHPPSSSNVTTGPNDGSSGG